MVALYTTISR
jgi:hypothetical protein